MIKRLIAIIFIIFIAQVAPAADFGPVWEKTILPHEGGYANNIHDPGNWTGCKEGQGRMLGTKYGISACAYGTTLLKKGIIIKHMTPDQARVIFERDYWLKYHFEKLASQGIADELCDESVNMGGGAAEALLGKVFREIEWSRRAPVPVPAEFTPETIAWINQFTKERPNRIAFYNSIRIKRVKFYIDLVHRRPVMRQFLLSWIDRSVD